MARFDVQAAVVRFAVLKEIIKAAEAELKELGETLLPYTNQNGDTLTAPNGTELVRQENVKNEYSLDAIRAAIGDKNTLALAQINGPRVSAALKVGLGDGKGRVEPAALLAILQGTAGNPPALTTTRTPYLKVKTPGAVEPQVKAFRIG